MKLHDVSYWMALAHLPGWRTERINNLIIEILYKKKFTLAEFFALSKDSWLQKFCLNVKECTDLVKAKESLPNLSFLAEHLTEHGFRIIPFTSDEYSGVLKFNLNAKYAPPLLYVKGNTKLLNQPSVAVVGSRSASTAALDFTETICRRFAAEGKVVVSGYAKGVDRSALEATLKYGGQSIVVLPQGILTFNSGFRKLYTYLVEGNVLVTSTYFPKAPWSVGLAMNRNKIIYGLSREIYVAESNFKGGTWSGVVDGLGRGRKIFVRVPELNEKCANKVLISKGAIPIDDRGKPYTGKPGHELLVKDPRESYSKESLEARLIRLLSFKEPLTAREIKERLQLNIETRKLSGMLKKMDSIETIPGKLSLRFSAKSDKYKQTRLFNEKTL